MHIIRCNGSSCSYTSPMWILGIITIILILEETEVLGGQEPALKLHSAGVGTHPRPLALYPYYICVVQYSRH